MGLDQIDEIKIENKFVDFIGKVKNNNNIFYKENFES